MKLTSFIVGSKVVILTGVICIITAHYVFSQKWLESIASHEAVRDNIERECADQLKEKRCIEQINKLNSNGQTGLMVQARLGRLEDVKSLLKYKADPNIISQDAERTTALHLACRSVDFEDGDKIVRRLLRAGAKAKIKDAHGNLPLHDLLSAASKDKKQALATLMIDKYKVKLNTPNNDGDTPLHIGITKNDLDWVTYMVDKYDKKIDFTLKNNLGHTLLSLAELYGYDQIVAIIKNGMAKQKSTQR